MFFSPDSEITYKVALSKTRGVTLELIQRIIENGIGYEDFFSLRDIELASALGCGKQLEFLDKSVREEALIIARKEEEFIRRHNINVHFIADEEYPVRMANCHSAPAVIYQLGDCDLNSEHCLSIVGTRRITPYGAESIKNIVKEIGESFPDLCVWSGLAYGCDAIAHTAALDNGLKTVAVVAHGLDQIYPSGNRDLAKRILKSGGAIVTEYISGSRPYKGSFLERNRIVAWATDATIVIESEIKGGAMSTANHAFVENRDVFALPGRSSDRMSGGCNKLIRTHKAGLITSGAEIIEGLGWQQEFEIQHSRMTGLFPELEGDTAKVFATLKGAQEPMSLDEIHSVSNIPISSLLGLLTEMEFDNLVIKCPGNRYMPA